MTFEEISSLSPHANIRFANLEDAKAIARVHLQAWHESYIGLINTHYINSVTYEDRLKLRYQIFNEQNSQSCCLMACQKGHIIGFSDLGPSRDSADTKGEIYSLYLLQAYKKQGIGSELMKQIRRYFARTDLYPFIVWVLEENKIARQFYESQGGIQYRCEMSKIGDTFYPEICYKFEF